jgi:L-cystine uptake protein TcyP (sodium:dicarboxylate symporter family)
MASDDSSPGASPEQQKRSSRQKKSTFQLELLEKVYAGMNLFWNIHHILISSDVRMVKLSSKCACKIVFCFVSRSKNAPGRVEDTGTKRLYYHSVTCHGFCAEYFARIGSKPLSICPFGLSVLWSRE